MVVCMPASFSFLMSVAEIMPFSWSLSIDSHCCGGGTRAGGQARCRPAAEGARGKAVHLVLRALDLRMLVLQALDQSLVLPFLLVSDGVGHLVGGESGGGAVGRW